MNKMSEINELLQNRENLYSLLSRIYLLELDEKRLFAMKKMVFPEIAGDDALGEGFALLAAYLNRTDESSIEELAVDYARIFLSAGVAQGLAAFPYESLYTGDRHMMAQEPAGEVTKLYAAKGLTPGSAGFKTPSDHIGLETAFLARLCKDARDALVGGNRTAYLDSMREQREFLEKHLFQWFSIFCTGVGKYASTDFYKAAAKITQGFLERERILMNGSEELWAIE